MAALARVPSQRVSRRSANTRQNAGSITREKALSAMQALGYRPDAAARALVTGRFRMLGAASFDAVPTATPVRSA
ncbi:hypothetical protein [Streptomyces sp. S1]|uniref:hypothetical protein n=1 Tax=Streptomyces sp. S1 TaxID=718288 RepID=UPI001F09CA45|nr:hypothetical protein [Streptomyces sp. S1]